MNTFSLTLALAMLLAATPSQQPAPAPKTTPAEQAFRDGWWAESGQGDLNGALAKYLAAAGAEGPAPVRAKALLNAGAVQQRLGKSESAIATFRLLLKEHPAEAETVEQARVHLRELTAVDLTQGYDEWYERRLFGEEVQLQILDKIQGLAAELAQPAAAEHDARTVQVQRQQAIRGEILAFGKGAVPALRKTCESGSEALAEAAVEMLFELRQVPPFDVLCRLTGWTYDPACWRLLLGGAGTSEQRPQPVEPSPHERLVFAALTGAHSLADTVLQMTFGDDYNPVAPIATALMQRDAESRQRIREAMLQRQVPLATRTALQSALVECEPKPPFTAAEWLAIGEDPLVFELRGTAVDMTARLLGEADGALLDALLERVATAPPSTRSQFVDRLAAGLRSNGSPLVVPWTAGRLGKLVRLGGTSADSDIAAVFRVIRADAELRAKLAAALLADPVAMQECFCSTAADAPQPSKSLRDMLDWSSLDDQQGELLALRWHTSLRDVLAPAWPGWSDEVRLAATCVVRELVAPFAGGKPLHDFFTGVRKEAHESLHSSIDALLEQLNR